MHSYTHTSTNECVSIYFCFFYRNAKAFWLFYFDRFHRKRPHNIVCTLIETLERRVNLRSLHSEAIFFTNSLTNVVYVKLISLLISWYSINYLSRFGISIWRQGRRWSLYLHPVDKCRTCNRHNSWKLPSINTRHQTNTSGERPNFFSPREQKVTQLKGGPSAQNKQDILYVIERQNSTRTSSCKINDL